MLPSPPTIFNDVKELRNRTGNRGFFRCSITPNLFKNERLAVLCQAGANSPLFLKNQTVPKLSPPDPVYLPFDIPDWSKLRNFPGYAGAFDGLNNLGYIFVGKPRLLGEARH